MPGAARLAGTAQLQIHFGDFEAVIGAAHGFHAGLAVSGQLVICDEDAIRLVGTATHATAQLVQLRQTEAVGVLNDHHRGVGYVHAHLDNRCGHHDLRIPINKTLHFKVFVLRAQPAVADAKLVLWLGEVVQQSLVTLLKRNHIRVFRLLDAGIDHINLSPECNLLLHEHHDAVAVVAIDMISLHGLSSWWQLIDFGDIEVAVLRHGEGTWDGRGGHHQGMRWNLGSLVKF